MPAFICTGRLSLSLFIVRAFILSISFKPRRINGLSWRVILFSKSRARQFIHILKLHFKQFISSLLMSFFLRLENDF